MGSKGDNVNADFPEWAGRQLLAEALRAAGLPVVFGAMWRRPRDTMTMRQRLQAIEVGGRVLDEARRRLPPGVSGAVLVGEWREAAWRCTVAGLALLDAQVRERLADDRERRAAQAEPCREPAAPPAVAAPARFRIYREGELPRAS